MNKILEKIKNWLLPPRVHIDTIEIEADSWVKASFKLGKEKSAEARQYLEYLIESYRRRDGKLDLKKLEKKIRFVEDCQETTRENIKKRAPKLWRTYLEYRRCMEAYTRGAGLCCHIKFNGKKIKPLTLADWMHTEDVGCQTAMYRLSKNRLLFWHTEEDSEVEFAGVNREDRKKLILNQKASIVKWKIKGEEEFSFFSYPYLMPGNAYAWGKNWIHGVDFLYLKSPTEPAALANMALWMTLRLRKSHDSQKIIKNLSPYINGFALNEAKIVEGEIKAIKILFAGNIVEKKIMDDKPGTFLYQHNMFVKDDIGQKIKRKYFEDPYDEEEYYRERELINQLFIEQNRDYFKRANTVDIIKKVNGLMGSKLGEYPYDSPWRHSYIVAVIDKKGLTTLVR